MNETTTNKRAPEKMAERATHAPPVDIFESKDELLILADVPGVVSESLAVNLDRDHLTIEARRAERSAGAEAVDYRRTFVVPWGIDSAKIAASLQNGVLRLVLPKPGALKPRQIEVKAG
jgi:HSP20 family protein